LKKFKKIYIEITNHCNLACSFCRRSGRTKAHMEPATFAGVLGRLRAHTDHLSLHVLGEPLLHPDLAALLRICNTHHLRVNLTTNGTLLTQNRNVLLNSPALRQINISLHSYERDDIGPALKIYLAAVFDFIREATRHTPLFISLRLWNLAETGNKDRRQIDALLHALEDHFGLPGQLTLALSPTRGIPLRPRVYLSLAHRFTWPHDPGPEAEVSGFCLGLRDHVAILVDGTVVPCCLDSEGDMALGNIQQQSLAAILAGARAVAIRRGFASQKLVEALCRRCTYRRKFKAA
jgi:radical SAM protein with 4Fe4S-binding SPASM domain